MIKGISETTENGARQQKHEYLSMLLGTLVASLLKHLLVGKGVIRTIKRTIIVGQNV